MTSSKNKTLDCFGNLEIVFPLGDDGLRHTPTPCLKCPYKTECLRTGLKGKAGLKVHAEHVDRSYDSGMIGFVERWSKKKAIDRKKNSGKASQSRWRLLRRKTKLSQ